MKYLKPFKYALSLTTLIGLGALSAAALADNVINDNLIVIGSECVGQDCTNGESFGFDTLRIKENNVRLNFDDTSASASFPNNDWRIIANDSTNGGANYLAIEDSTAGRQPFRVDAGAPASSLHIDSAGDVGIGTSNAVVEVHVADGDSPTLRLEQNGSSGFGAQTWDIAGNETNFFVRDVTNGSLLPFRIKPGSPADSIFIEPTQIRVGTSAQDIGMGTSTPTGSLHVSRDVSGVKPDLLQLTNNGDVRFKLEDTAAAGFWRMSVENSANQFVITRSGTGSPELKLTNTGDLDIRGSLTANVGSTNDTFPDYVFERTYPLMKLSKLEQFITQNKHLPNIPSKADVSANGGQLNMTEMQLKLLEKVEELTLYTIQQQDIINQQEKNISENSRLKTRLASLEKLVTNLASSKENMPVNGNKVAVSNTQ